MYGTLHDYFTRVFAASSDRSRSEYLYTYTSQKLDVGPIKKYRDAFAREESNVRARTIAIRARARKALNAH